MAIKDPAGVEIERVEYAYDVYDRQLARDHVAEGATSRQVWIYDGDNAALLYDVDPTTLTATLAQRLYYTGTDQLLAVHDVAHDRMLWTLTDRQGSVRGLWGLETAESTPGLLVYREYGVYGELREENLLPVGERIFVSAGYTGRDYDPDVELYNYRSRNYDPQLGMFAQEDGIGIAADLNRYRYVGNSPMNGTDPSGHVPQAVGAAVGAVFGWAIYVGTNLYYDRDITWSGAMGAAVGGATQSLITQIGETGIGQVRAALSAVGIRRARKQTTWHHLEGTQNTVRPPAAGRR